MPNGTRPSHYRRPSRVAVYVAPSLGLRPGAVEQLIKGRDGCHHRTAKILGGAMALRDFDLAARILAPIRAVEAGASITETSADLLALDVAADAGEDSPRFAFGHIASPENRNALLRHACQRAGILYRLIAALQREQQEARS